MRVIHKQVLKLARQNELEVEQGSKFLTCLMQMGELCVWYECTPGAPKVKRVIYIHTTGDEKEDEQFDGAMYLNTLLLNEHTITFHIYVGWEL